MVSDSVGLASEFFPSQNPRTQVAEPRFGLWCRLQHPRPRALRTPGHVGKAPPSKSHAQSPVQPISVTDSVLSVG